MVDRGRVCIEQVDANLFLADGPRAAVKVIDRLLGQSVIVPVVSTPTTGFTVRRVREKQIAPDQKGIYFLPGSLPVVVNELARRGYMVSVQRRFQPAPLGTPSVKAAAGAVRDDEESLLWLQNHERGILRLHGSAIGELVVAHAAKAWPEAKIAYVCASKEESFRVARYLRRFVGKKNVGAVGDDSTEEGFRRVVVGTWGGFSRVMEGFQLVFCGDAVQALEIHTLKAIQFAYRARLFGFLHEHKLYSKSELAAARQLFGDDEREIAGEGKVWVPVDLAVMKIRSAKAVASDDPIKIKRLGITGNGHRNRLVAALADAIGRNDGAKITGFIGAEAASTIPVKPRVVVLANDIEHAVNLVSEPKLRDSVIMAGNQTDLAERLRRRKIELPAAWKFRIFTLASATKIDAGTVDVLIRADGGSGLPPIRQESSTARNGHRFLLIDFADWSHQLLRRFTQQRLSAYDRVGWKVVAGEGNSAAG